MRRGLTSRARSILRTCQSKRGRGRRRSRGGLCDVTLTSSLNRKLRSLSRRSRVRSLTTFTRPPKGTILRRMRHRNRLCLPARVRVANVRLRLNTPFVMISSTRTSLWFTIVVRKVPRLRRVRTLITRRSLFIGRHSMTQSVRRVYRRTVTYYKPLGGARLRPP